MSEALSVELSDTLECNYLRGITAENLFTGGGDNSPWHCVSRDDR